MNSTNILTRKLFIYTYNNILDVQVPIPQDIYSRLKAVEDRVLLLERLSPLGKQHMP